MPIEELLSKLSPHAKDVYQQAIFVNMVRELNDGVTRLRNSMETNANASDVLAKKVHRLNIVLTCATIIVALATIAGVVIAAIQLYK
jgi:ABC-type dipeptide/oligopeptide/nickel transport system permease subunit